MNSSDFVILIVDDNPSNLVTLQALLGKIKGCRIIEAISGEEALRQTLSESIDLILMDIQMPNMDGFEAADHLKMTKRTQTIPVIFVTAVFKGDEFIQRGYELGAVDYLTKPIDDNLLLNRIQHYKTLNQKQKELEHALKELKLVTQALQEERDQLEFRVSQRTQELSQANQDLNKEIHQRKEIQKQLEIAKEKAEMANQLKSNFIATMSHEIRTPMNGILGMTQILMSEKLPKDIETKVNVVHHSSEALLLILNDILDFSRIEAGRMKLYQDTFNLYALMSNLTDLFQASCSAKSLEFKIDIDPKVPKTVLGDQIQIHKILSNLIGNAIKFTPPLGTIQIRIQRLSQNGDHVILRFEVQDSGIGIKKNDLDSIFIAFIQSDVSSHRTLGGTGLGLSISKNLVILMSGKIGVQSELGKGSLFWVEIPLTVLSSENVTEVAAKKISLPTKKIGPTHVLVVEDERTNQIVVQHMLEKLDCKVTIAQNGEEGVKQALTGKFNIIFMDCFMPIMDGYEATRLIREKEGDQHLPIIALTAKSEADNWDQCREAGMDGFLSKPIIFEQLNQVVKKYTENNP